MPTIINSDPNERCSRCNRTHDNHDKEYCQSQPTPERSKCCNAEILTGLNDDNGEDIAWCSKCVRPCPVPQTPPVNSREDTGTRGEECDCVCEDCKGRKHFNYKDVKCINYQSPLADTERCKDCGGPGHSTCGFRADMVGGECNGIAHYFPEDELTCSCGQMGRPSTPPSKQSEECYVDSRTPEEKANEPSATVTSAGGPMTVALTPPKAEGATVSQDQTVKESLTVTPSHISKMETTKAEGVGEWDDITVDTVSLKKMISTTIEVLSHKDAAEQVWSDVCKALTSATRVAEERKDQAIRIFISEQRCINNVVPESDTSKGVRTILDRLEKLLPPPPDKPTQP